MGKKSKINQKKEKQKKVVLIKSNNSSNYDLSNFQKIITDKISLNDQKLKDTISGKIKNEKYSPINLNINKILESEDPDDKEYSKKYSRYINEELNSQLILMILKYIKESKIFQNEHKNDFNFIFEFTTVIKNLFFNEFELSALALCLDDIGWTSWLNFYFISLTVKKILMSEQNAKNYLLLVNILNKYNKDFITSFNIWSKNFRVNIVKLENLELTKINQKFIELSKHIYDFNKKKFIDYNNLVNEILLNEKNKTHNEKEEKTEITNPSKINVNQNNLNISNINNNNSINNNNNNENLINLGYQNSLGIISRYSSNLFNWSRNSFDESSFMRNLFDLNPYNISRSFNNMSGSLDLVRAFSSSSFKNI